MCALIGVCAVIRSNTVCCGYSLEVSWWSTSHEYLLHDFLAMPLAQQSNI